jgi:hypothetical protein
LNARELCKLADVKVDLTGGESSRSTPTSLIKDACYRLSEKLSSHGTPIYVAVTDGPYPSHLIPLIPLDGASKELGTRLIVPPLPREMRNPIG